MDEVVHFTHIMSGQMFQKKIKKTKNHSCSAFDSSSSHVSLCFFLDVQSHSAAFPPGYYAIPGENCFSYALQNLECFFLKKLFFECMWK